MKKQITVRLEKKMIDKIDKAAQKETRTRNQQIEHILKESIKVYEKKHGEIKTKE